MLWLLLITIGEKVNASFVGVILFYDKVIHKNVIYIESTAD